MLHVVITDESVWTWKGHSKVSTFEKVPIHQGHPNNITFKTLLTVLIVLIFYQKQYKYCICQSHTQYSII